MKRIAILGSTGSIGCSSLKVIEAHPEAYQVMALAAGKNIDLLAEQIRKFRPLEVAVLGDQEAESLKERLGGGQKTRIVSGREGFIHLATLEEVDTVISAITGAAGLVPTYAAIRAGKNIALANKETMVMAGPLVMEEAKRRGVAVLPVDSEHSAILQCLQGHPRDDVRRVILTASGGPFKDFSHEEMEKVTPEQALKHPNWNMGPKITVDSATLMNKGLELIEAKWLFKLDIHQIHILIHPQSVVHSMVEYRDGSIIAQLGIPDMITPISYALSYPRHVDTPLRPLDLEEVGTLRFMKADTRKFRCLELALRAAEIGDSMPAVLNGANEVAVDLFLKGRIGFLQIPSLIERTMDAHRPFVIDRIEKVMEADAWARERAADFADRDIAAHRG
ncbi:MAG: 1-deoxy-D-xylulose-5-phosphate reductoisomerase [Deltaproteobacteria bacterium]|nr:1-deoxy-D-xylulose-5-phosphate reductoisomerase [Deltaproteobacteria bacterium]